MIQLDASAFWRVGSSNLDPDRRDQISDWIARGLVYASTPLLLETRAGRKPPHVDPAELPSLWISERAERRAVELQTQMRTAHRQLGIPPLDYLIASIAEDHGATLLHYDSDFERLASHTDLATEVELLAPLGWLD